MMSHELPAWHHLARQDHLYKSRSSSSAFAGALLVPMLVVIYLELAPYLFSVDARLLPKYTYYVMFAFMLPLLALRYRRLFRYAGSPFALWVAALVAFNAAHLFAAMLDLEHERIALIVTRIQYYVLAWMIVFACSEARDQLLDRAFLALAVLLPCVTLFDFLNPGLMDPEGIVGRGAGTYLNPNKAGEGLLVTYLLAVRLMTPRWRWWLLVWVGIAVVSTFSRGGIAAWAAIVLGLLVTGRVPRVMILFSVVAIVLIPIGWVGVENYLIGRADMAEGIDNIFGRIESLQSLSFDDASVAERAAVTSAGWNLFLDNFIFGAGAGATHLWALPVSVHDQALMMAAEYGIVGVCMWLWSIVIVIRGKYYPDPLLQWLAALVLVFLSMFSHNIFDFLYWLVSIGLFSRRRST